MTLPEVNKPHRIRQNLHLVSSSQAALIFVAMLFQHFQFATPSGYPLTLGAVAAIALFFVLPGRVVWASVVWVLPAVVAYTAIAGLFDPKYSSPGLRYAHTLALVCVAVAFVLAGHRGVVPAPTRQRLPMYLPLMVALHLIVGLAVIQVVTGLNGSSAFFNVFGPFQYLYHYDPWLTPGMIPRAESFFLEPSYAALVITCIVAILLKISHAYRLTLLLGGLGVLACQSATGLVVYAVIVLVWGLGSSRTAARVSVIVALGLMLMTGGYLLTRITSGQDSTSSTNYRFVAPLELLSDVLTWNPLGRALGSVEAAVSAANLRNGQDAGVSIDNGYFLLIFYFGWVGLAVCFLIIAFLLHQMTYAIRNGTGKAPLFAWLLFSFMFTGGIFLPEFAFMVWLSLGVAMSDKSENLDDFAS